MNADHTFKVTANIHYWEQPCENYVKCMRKPCEIFWHMKHPVKHHVMFVVTQNTSPCETKCFLAIRKPAFILPCEKVCEICKAM